MKTPFFTPACRSRSKTLADAELKNLYPEIVETKQGKAIGAFYTTPGLDLLEAIGSGPVRAFHVTAGVLYVVSGGQVYQADPITYAGTLMGNLPSSSGPCQIIDNGTQTLIFDGNTWQTLTVANITTAGSGGTDGTYPIPIPAPGTNGTQATGLFTITGGSISNVQIIYGGANYPANIVLSNADLAAVPGIGALTGASITLTSSGGVAFAIAQQFSVLSVLVSSTGGLTSNPYATNDLITLTGGVFTQPAQIRITTTQVTATGSATSGGVTGSHVLNAGSGFPPGWLETDVPVVGGTGSGALAKVQSHFGGGAFASLITSPGHGYTVGDVLVPQTTGGTGLSLTVTSVNGVGIVSAGTGGTPGPVVLTGTTGTGTKFQINATISGAGSLSSLGAVAVSGAYTANPTDPQNEPVTGGGLTGAVIAVVMGASTASVVSGGRYSNQVTLMSQQFTTGVGAGATWVPTYNAPSGVLSMVPVSLPFSGTTSATYQDGFGLANEANSTTFWQSDLDDLTVWDPLNFSSADSNPDYIVALHDVSRELWILKQTNTEVWINAGLPNFAFQRLDGVLIEYGCLAVSSVARTGSSLIWLSRSSEGQAMVVMSRGYNIQVISTHALQYAMEQYGTLSDAIGFTYQQEGHTFYVLTFPTGNATWCYDVTTSAEMGAPMWHERPFFSAGVFSRNLANCYVFFNSLNIVGDFSNGNIYKMNLDSGTDNGQTRKWVKSWRALPQPIFDPVRFGSLLIDMQTGIGVAPSSNPQVVLDWSDNDGQNWSNESFRAAGQTGQTSLRVKFNRIGSTRRNSGLDRIFRISSTDVFAVGLIGAELMDE